MLRKDVIDWSVTKCFRDRSKGKFLYGHRAWYTRPERSSTLVHLPLQTSLEQVLASFPEPARPIVCQVAEHCSPSDAWVSFLGQVFDITKLMRCSLVRPSHSFGVHRATVSFGCLEASLCAEKRRAACRAPA